MKKLETILKALADGKRLRVLRLLAAGPLCVCELAAILGSTQPAISKHLKKLKHSGLIDSEQDGFWTNYFLTKSKDPHVKALTACVSKWLKDDKTIKNDARQARIISRKNLCCKKERKKR